MQPRTKGFVAGAFVMAVIAAFVSAESDHQEDLRQMEQTRYAPSLYGSSDTNN